MAIKPILFNTEMVRAILDGRKSCTRRICKDANEYTVPDMDFYNADRRTYAVHNFADKEQMEQLSTAERTCPICPDDILYVRETWERFECWNCEGDEIGNCPKEPQKSVLDKTCGCYMYRATDEMLQEMEKLDAVKEGIDPRLCISLGHALMKFKKLWNSTIKKSDLDCYGWDANPWVWVIEFERCEKPKGV